MRIRLEGHVRSVYEYVFPRISLTLLQSVIIAPTQGA